MVKLRATVMLVVLFWCATALLLNRDANRKAGQGLFNFDYDNLTNPLMQIHKALIKCPDESPAPGTSELSFVTDSELRANLRSDIGAIERALSNGEWKAAAVLAGATIEVLLPWSLSQRPRSDVDAAIAALAKSGELSSQPDRQLERGNLHEYTEVAAELGIIEDDTYTKTNLAREYRNLIHPGRAQRLGQHCDRGTALSCVAALDHVVRDLA